MSNKREILSYLGLDEALVFDCPNFDTAIIGTTEDGRVVYDFELMVRQLSEDDGMSYEDAIDFIEYNTIRSLPYAGERAPIIIYNTLEF